MTSTFVVSKPASKLICTFLVRSAGFDPTTHRRSDAPLLFVCNWGFFLCKNRLKIILKRTGVQRQTDSTIFGTFVVHPSVETKYYPNERVRAICDGLHGARVYCAFYGVRTLLKTGISHIHHTSVYVHVVLREMNSRHE